MPSAANRRQNYKKCMLNCLKLLSNLIRKERLPVKAFYFKSLNKQLDRNQKFISVHGGCFLLSFPPFLSFSPPSLSFPSLFSLPRGSKWPLKYRGRIWRKRTQKRIFGVYKARERAWSFGC